MPRRKIALIEIQQETNSFSPLLTTLKEFEWSFLKYGDDILPEAKTSKFQTGGFYKAMTEYGRNTVELVPIICAWAQSGGPLSEDTFAHFKAVIEHSLIQHPDLAGIWLSLHGAMGVQSMTDPEGNLLEWLRERVGNEIPIGVPLDLHANVTQRMVKHATFISAYHTNPHRDHFQTGYKSGKVLIDTVLGKAKPTMAFRKMRLLKGGGYTIDFLQPMRAIFRRMRQMEKIPGVLSVANFPCHIWLDEPELGWSTVVVTNNNPILADQLAKELADLNWSVRKIAHPQPVTPESAIEKVKQAKFRRLVGTAILCDVSDIVSAGAPGENTHLIRAILEQAPSLVSYTSIRDAQVAQMAFDQPEGSWLKATIGGKLEPRFNRSLDFEGKVIRKFESQLTGKVVVLQHEGTHIVVSENPNPVMKPQFYQDLGLNLWKADLVTVKNLFPFRYHFLKYNRLTINVLSAGTTNVDVHQLDYKYIPRPIFPLDGIESW
jgi:microcystin degradation protein MlrC